MILSPFGTILIDPYAEGNTTNYITYWKRDAANTAAGFPCDFVDDRANSPAPNRPRLCRPLLPGRPCARIASPSPPTTNTASRSKPGWLPDVIAGGGAIRVTKVR
ncbi:MAG: hypothetical protein ACJ8NS_15090 [Chthoniobacterales bacterium]